MNKQKTEQPIELQAFVNLKRTIQRLKGRKRCGCGKSISANKSACFACTAK
jgi:hypothetical protein